MIPVHSLWVGNDAPSLVNKLGPLSFIAHGHQFNLWTYQPESAASWFPQARLRDANEIMPVQEMFGTSRFNPRQIWQHFSDLFRMLLVAKTGEWWTDLDVTLLKPLPESPVIRVWANASHNEGYSLPLFRCPKNYGPLLKAFERTYPQLRDPSNTDWMYSARMFREAMGGLLPDILFTGMGCTSLLNILRSCPYATIPDWPAIHWCSSGFAGDWNKPVENTVYWKLLKQYRLI